MATLDLSKLSRVHALMERGATAGEREAARSRAEAMARAAGMTLDDALSKLDSSPTAAREPSGWDDFWAKMKRERWEEEAPQREEALRTFQSEEAIFAPTERERSLSEAIANVEPFDPSEPTEAAKAAVKLAYPMPSRLAEALREWRGWYELWRLRRLFEHSYEHDAGVQVREDVLRHMLEKDPDPTLDGVAARLEFVRFLESEVGSITEIGRILSTLAHDVEMLRASKDGGSGVHFGQRPVHKASMARRTNAEKRADVLALLESSPQLTDREIARRVGVSPQTVNNWRRRYRGTPRHVV